MGDVGRLQGDRDDDLDSSQERDQLPVGAVVDEQFQSPMGFYYRWKGRTGRAMDQRRSSFNPLWASITVGRFGGYQINHSSIKFQSPMGFYYRWKRATLSAHSPIWVSFNPLWASITVGRGVLFPHQDRGRGVSIPYGLLLPLEEGYHIAVAILSSSLLRSPIRPRSSTPAVHSI